MGKGVEQLVSFNGSGKKDRKNGNDPFCLPSTLKMNIPSGDEIFGSDKKSPKDVQFEKKYEEGENYFNNNNYKKAIECFEKVIQLDPDYLSAYNFLAKIYRSKEI